MRKRFSAVAVVELIAATDARPQPQTDVSGDGWLPPAERAYGAVSGRFDRDAAMEIVRFMDPF